MRGYTPGLLAAAFAPFGIMIGAAGCLAAEPVEYVRIADTYAGGFFYIPGTDTVLRIGGGYLNTRTGSDDTGFGTIVLGPGLEPKLAFAPKDLDGYFLGLAIDVPLSPKVSLFGKDWSLSGNAQLAYTSVDGDGSAREEPGGLSTAITYPYMADFGSTGLFLGGTGLAARSELEIDSYEAYLGLNLARPCPSGDGAYGFGATLGWRHRDSDHHGSAWSLTFPGIRADEHDEVSDDFAFMKLHVGGSYLPAPKLMLSGQVYAGGGIAWGDLSGAFRSQCDICPPAEMDLRLPLNRSDSKGAFLGGVNLGVTYSMAPGVSATAFGIYDYRSDAFVVRNRNNPSDKETDLETTDEQRILLGLSMNVKF